MITNGVDIVSVDRIRRSLERSGEAFLRRVCTEQEIALMGSGNEARRAEFLAGRFAAKEAISKALGTGFGVLGVALTDMEILREESGAPYVVLHGKVRAVYEEKGGKNVSISISHDGGMAVAFCTIEWKDKGD
ncbi:MAG: holo-ACP synthase [Clostridiales bacterium]|nr:holo-ACP synthase [Clostridiales bacterium]